jgi:hypothetical protein
MNTEYLATNYYTLNLTPNRVIIVPQLEYYNHSIEKRAILNVKKH